MSDITSIVGGAPTSAGPSLGSMVQGPGGKLGKDEFLKMLVAQLRHQDPMNPMEGQEFAAQLAQFSSVEQLVSLNAQFTAQAESTALLAESLSNNGALSTIGRTVLAVGDQVELPAGEGAADTTVTFGVGGDGGRATLTLYDATGREVGSRDLGYVGGGRRSAELGDAAAELEPGVYRYEVTVLDSAGEPVPVTTFTSGTVDGVRYGADGATLTAGELTIGVGQIVQVGR
jgi:flagellar basal-body rod modification protein FlgD